MADGTVVIDMKIDQSKFKSDKEEIENELKRLGNGAGSAMDMSFSRNADKLKKTASDTHRQVSEQLGKPITTHMHGDNHDLVGKARRAQRDMHKIPDRHNTDITARNLTGNVFQRIKNSFLGLNREGQKTHSIFKSVLAASFVHDAAISSWNALRGAISSTWGAAKRYALAQQTMNATWLTLTNNAAKGRAMVRQINNMAIAAQNSTEMVDRLSQKFYAINNNAKQTGKLTQSILTLQDAFGQTDAAVENFSTQFSQMMANGKVSAQDMMSIVNVFPKLRPMLLDYERRIHHSRTMTMAEMNKLISAGKVKSQDMINVVLEAGKKYKAATGNFTKTIPGMTRVVRAQMPVLLSAFTKPFAKMESPIYGAVVKWISSKKTQSAFSSLGKTVSTGMNKVANALAGGKNVNVAKGLDNALNGINRALRGIFNYLADHAKDLKDIAIDVGSIAGQIGKAVWKDFASIIKSIGAMFGITAKNGKSSGSALHVIAQLLNSITKNKFAIQAVSKAIIAMAAVKGLTRVGNGIGGITSASYGAYRKVSALRAGLKGIEDVKKFKGAEGAFNSLGLSISKVMPKIKGLLGFKGASAGKFTGVLQSLRSARQTGGLTTAGKVATGAAVAGIAVDSGADIYKAIKAKAGSKKQYEDIGSGAGKAIGGGIGLYFGGPLGAAIGAKIGGAVGKWAGDAAKKFQNGWNAKKPPKKFWSLENLGWSTHDMINKVGKWGRNTAKSFGKGLNNAKKDISSFGKNISKGVNGGMNKTAKAFKKGWNTIYKHSSKGTRQIMRGTAKFAKSYVKTNQKANKATIKNFSSFGSRLKKNHGNLFKTIGQTAKTQLGIEKKRWKGNFKAIHGLAVSWGKGLHSNMLATYRKLNKATHGGLGKVLNGFKSFGRNIWNFWHGLFTKISNFFKQTLGNINKGLSNVGKFFTGKLKVGSLHLANGTDWRRRYPVPAIVNDGYDSPETNNREGLIDTDGTLRPFPNIRNFRYWLWPGQEVVNARDMAMFGAVRHFAKGTTNFGGGAIGRTSGVTSIRSLTRELKDLEKTLKQVRKLSRINVTAKGLAKTLKDVSRLNKTLKSIDKEGTRANRNFKALTNRLTSLTRKIKSFYSTIKKYNFGKAIAKEASQAVKGLRGKGNFANEFSKLTSKFKKTAKSLQENFHKTWTDTWKHADKTFKSWTKTTENELNRFKRSFERGWKSIDSGVTKIFSKFWSTMRTLAGKGMNRVISIVNSGISKINGVVHRFGGHTHSIGYAGHVHYANGTSTALQKPTFAVVNDGNDSPETGNKESFFDHNTGTFGIFQGRNTHMLIPAGVDIFKASDTRDFMHSLGYSHFAGGTGGGLKQLYELTKRYYKNPNGTLDDMMTTSIGMHGAINQIATGMAKRVQDQAEDWWKTLWTMVHKKIDSGSASGLLKAVEKYGNGHKYVWGAAGPSTFDCSGLVMYALKKEYGISYPHFSGAQYARTRHISKSEARPGDLVFWGPGGSDHVGVYAGGNRYYSAQSPSMGIHMNTLSSVVGKGAPKFGRIRGINPQGQSATVKANTALEKLIRAQVGQGFWKTIQKIADKYGESAYGIAGKPSGDHGHWMAQAHIPRRDWGMLNWIISGESGWNPHARNPSSGTYGLGQMQSYNLHYYRRHGGVNNPIAQLMGIMDYIDDRYGSVAHAYAFRKSHGWYANGGFVTEPTDATIGEGNGPEVVLPYGDPAKRERTLQLMQATIAQMQAQDGQSAEVKTDKQVTMNLEATNAAIAEMNSKFDKALQALGIIQGKDTKVYVTNDIDPKKVGTAIYPVIKQMDSSNIRKAGANLSGYQSY